MINKIKAEIEELEKRYEEEKREGIHKHCFSWGKAILLEKIEVYKECLNWAEEEKTKTDKIIDKWADSIHYGKTLTPKEACGEDTIDSLKRMIEKNKGGE